MNLPREDHHIWRVAKVIYQYGSISLDRGIEIHGYFGSKRRDTREVYHRAVASGHLILNGGKYELAPYMADAMETRLANQAKKGNVATPRTAQQFNVIQPKYIPSAEGTRPGSNEFRQWGSKHV